MKFANSKEFITQLEEVNDYFILESVVKALDITSHNFEVADTFVEMYKKSIYNRRLFSSSSKKLC